MICFKKIKWRNLLSTGNQWTEIDLNKKSNTVIIGTNGAGKSTMLDALTFVLFNKPFRKINKSQLVNATNEKDCVVELDFEIGSTEWFIRRGIKPNIFEIHRNGQMMNQSSAANDQQNDACLPPGLGGIRADIGMFGGENNCRLVLLFWLFNLEILK